MFDKLPFLKSLQKINDQVPDILGVGTLECEFFSPDGGEAESLREDFVRLLTGYRGDFRE